MRPLTERDIRASFVNCTKGEAKRLAVPRDLDAQPWDDLDFLGWHETRERAYLVTETVGVALRVTTAKRGLCSLCLTPHTHDGVALMTARKTGPRGQRGDSVGAYICADLACSLYLRGKKDSRRFEESLTLDEQVDRTMANLAAFLAKVTG
jgi:hypothetical protein